MRVSIYSIDGWHYTIDNDCTHNNNNERIYNPVFHYMYNILNKVL